MDFLPGEFEVFGSLPRNLCSEKSPAKIKAHDHHPGEHGNTNEVAKEAKGHTGNFGKTIVDYVVNNENEECLEEYAEHIAKYYLPVEIF